MGGAPNGEAVVELDGFEAGTGEDPDIGGPVGQEIEAVGAHPVMVSGTQQHRHGMEPTEHLAEERPRVGRDHVVLVEIPGAAQRVDPFGRSELDDGRQRVPQCLSPQAPGVWRCPPERRVEVQIGEQQQLHETRSHRTDGH